MVDRDRLTCCGGLAAVDLALEIIRSQQGIDLANAAARYIFQERLRPGEESQLSRSYEPIGSTVPELLRDAIIFMERNLEKPLRLSKIAHDVGISQRQLERLFRKFTGLTPMRYYINIRLYRARSLLTQTELSIAEIAPMPVASITLNILLALTSVTSKLFPAWIELRDVFPSNLDRFLVTWVFDELVRVIQLIIVTDWPEFPGFALTYKPINYLK